MARIVFITGTSTGVGKTVATGVLLYALRQRGVHALAVKPFCSGTRTDARHLRRLQDRELTIEEVNPFFYAPPLAPMVAARGGRGAPSLDEVLQHVKSVVRKCELLLVEGAGGLVVPLGPKDSASRSRARVATQCYTAADLIRRLGADVVVVAQNKLGTLNHTLLTLNALPPGRARAVILMEQRLPDLSARTNRQVLAELIAPSKVLRWPYLGRNPLCFEGLKINAKIPQKTLAEFFASSIVSPLFGKKSRAERETKGFDSR